MTKKKKVEKIPEKPHYPLGYYEPISIKNKDHDDVESIIGYLVKLSEHNWFPVNTELEAINLSLQVQILSRLNEE